MANTWPNLRINQLPQPQSTAQPYRGPTVRVVSSCIQAADGMLTPAPDQDLGFRAGLNGLAFGGPPGHVPAAGNGEPMLPFSAQNFSLSPTQELCGENARVPLMPTSERSISPEMQCHTRAPSATAPQASGVTQVQVQLGQLVAMRGAFMQPPSNHHSPDASCAPSVTPAGSTTPAAQADSAVQDQVQQLVNAARAQRPLLQDNAQLMNALTNFCPEYTVAVMGGIVSTLDERTGDAQQMHVNQVMMQNEIQELKAMIREYAAQMAEMRAALADGSGGIDGGGSGKNKTRSDNHPKMKSLIHDMFWKLCGVNEDDDDQEDNIMLLPLPPADHPDKVKQDGRTIWYPKWGKAVNNKPNAMFLTYLAQQVLENEKRECKEGRTNIPDASYKKDVADALAKGFFRYVSKAWTRRQTPSEGRAKHLLALQNARQHQRRAVKCTERRKSAVLFDAKFGVKGSATYVGTDYASDVVSLPEDETKISEAIKAARNAQKVGKNAWVTLQPPFRQKLYTLLLRILDQITYLHKNGLESTFMSDGAVTLPGLPPKKRHRTDTRAATEVFEVPSTERSTREPGKGRRSRKIVKPKAGMLQCHFLAETETSFNMQKDLEWWGTWKEKVSANEMLVLNEHMQAVLDQLEEDSADDEGSEDEEDDA